MAGFIELATLKAPVVADSKGFKVGMSIVKKEGKDAATEIEKEFQNASKKAATSWENASNKIQKSLKTTEKDAKELTKSAENIYKDGFGKSANDVVKSLMQTKRALGDVDSKELETATKRALELRDTIGVKMSTTLKMAKREMEMYGSSADQAFDRVNKKLEQNQAAWDKVGRSGEKLSTLGIALTAGITTPLIGLGVVAGKMASDFESANARVVSSLGLTEQQSAVTKQAIQDIYSDGFGESIDDVAESLIQVKRQLGDIPDDQIKKVTENAMVLRDTLGQDMGESLRGINSLMVNFGLSADDAMDLYVKGVQTGLDKTNELGDNLAEYGQLWSQAGFNAKDMFAVLDNGLKSGAYNLDKVNDFVKEFAISLNDGRIEKNLSSFSQGTRDVFSEFKNGNRTSQDVFKSIISDLESTTNQQDKLSLASTVWSALGEDNAMKIIESLNDVNGTYDNVAGSMEKVKQQQNETFGARAKSTFREAQTALLPLGEALLDIAEKYMPQLQKSVKSLSDTLSNLSEGDIDRILKIGGFVAIAGPTVVGIGKVTSAISTIGGALKLGAGALGLFETSAAAAGGAAGVGGLGASLVALAGPAAIAVGAIAIVAGGIWAVNKAYESNQLAGAKWGTEVTKEQDKVITKSYELGNKAKADVAAYADGVKSSAEDVVKSNNDIVDSIQKTVEKEAQRRKKNAEKIEDPEARKRAEEYADYKSKLDLKTVDSAKVTVGTINKIMADASQNNRNLSTEEKNYIAENYRSLSDAQLKSAGFTKTQRIAIESAYQKDISKLSDKQLQDRAENVMKGLDKEKSFYDKQKSYLKEVYGEGTESYKKEMENLNSTNHKNTETMILGLARLTKAQGFSLENMSGAWEKYGWTTQEVADLVKNSGEDSGKEAENLGKILKTMGRDWDSIDLDPKTGKLTVEGKEELVQSLLETSKWKTLSIDEKKLLVDGDESRVAFLDSLSDAKKWNQYKILEKEIGVNNSKAIQAIMEAENGVNRWNSLQPADKEFLAKNDKVLKVVLSSEQALQRYKDFPPAEQELLANNQDLLAKVLESEENLNRWNLLPAADKEFLAKNEKLLNTVLSSDEALRRYNEFPPAEQEFLGDNTDLLNVIIGSQEAFDNYSRLEPDEKQFIADNKDLINKVLTGTGSVEEFNRYPALMKMFNGVDATGQPVAFAKENINKFNQTKANPVVLSADNQASSVINGVLVDLDKLPKYRGISIGIERVGGGEKLPPGIFNAKGTPGLPQDQWAIVNDQKGALYEELITLPNGFSFIPKGRDVMLPLPKNTRIDKASDTDKIKRGLPHFADGLNNQQPLPFIGYNATFKPTSVSRVDTSSSVLDPGTSKVIQLLQLIYEKDMDVILNGKSVLDHFEKEMTRRSRV
ncbi:phage tail tape measure protein [Lactococcus laudensis]|uniref:Phage tail tape measure protein n=1 Tax=Pseudolactococcus laudensis TaxID=1494461 RepID=A0A7V8N1W1_9LACT|nr:phage tail tape measure protein [Lactococcus laudensis]MBA0017197.1 phage tail tape measure protein [Lactococcus laudensis]MBW9281871.1 hypothetical protein [Lactococcus laudensis]